MQLNRQTDYALRILMALAAAGERLSVEEIARQYDISRHHLAKVAQQLHALGFVNTVRGRNGGLELAREPRMINVGDVVRKFENLDGFVGCMQGGTGCVVGGVCGLQPALNGALGAFLCYLDGFQLDELVPDPRAFLLRLVG